MEIVRCSKCVFWDPCDVAEGHCRRHAPRLSDGQDIRVAWPRTHRDDGCGDGEMKWGSWKTDGGDE